GSSCDGIDGICLAEEVNGFTERCIWQQGETTCPAGPYTERTVYYSDSSDTRECASETCSCEPTGSCSATVGLETMGSCSPVPALSLSTGTCFDKGDLTIQYGHITDRDADELACVAQAFDGSVVGTVAQTGASTYCCLP